VLRGTRGVRTLVPCLIAVTTVGCSVLDDEFDSAKWKAVGRNLNCRDDTRLDMVHDLREKKLRRGMPVSKVRRMLGPPTEATRYPDREAERDARYHLRHSKAFYGMTREEYIELFGDPDDLPQAGSGWWWYTGMNFSDCESFYVRFLDGRAVEFG
jgi:hypothetical protein